MAVLAGRLEAQDCAPVVDKSTLNQSLPEPE
jgi:hypothetical protein